MERREPVVGPPRDYVRECVESRRIFAGHLLERRLISRHRRSTRIARRHRLEHFDAERFALELNRAGRPAGEIGTAAYGRAADADARTELPVGRLEPRSRVD